MQLRPHQLDAVTAMSNNTKGQVIVPTGGKTMCMIEDVKKLFRQDSLPKTVVVVAPRILLANQLSSEFLVKLDVITIKVSRLFTFIVERHIKDTTKTDQLEYWYH